MSRKLRQGAMHHNSHRRAVHLHGRFTLDGANNPSVFAGAIASVVRLETGGAVPFFRVQLDSSYQLTHPGVVKIATCEGPITTDLVPVFGDFTSDPLVERAALKEFDIVVKGGGTAVDTAGIVVHVWIALALAPLR